mgnify:FL=1
MNTWYKSLKRAPWSPPGYIFGIVWPILYLLMAISFMIVQQNKKCYPYCNALTFFIIQLIFNLSWTTIFFKLKMPKLALLDILCILVFALITLYKFGFINKIASLLLLPYIIWLFLALSLNTYIVVFN